MKCEKCWFCTYIGAGLLAPYPVKYCKYHKAYKFPFIQTADGKVGRQLDFSEVADCKIWYETGCNIHPSTVRKAKSDFIKSLEEKENE